MTTFIFPGQGSQTIGMGKELFARFPEMIYQASEILGYSLEKLCLEDPLQQLHQTQFTQPALYVVNALRYFAKSAESAQSPHYVAGHSLGEYNALLAAEAFDFVTGLKLVQKRGELMSQASAGAMAAVVGLTQEVVKGILEDNQLKQVSIANYNSYTQVVISGGTNEVEQAIPLLEKADALLVKRLMVSGAFHSPLMKSAQTAFESFLQDFDFRELKKTVISNVTARPYQPGEVKKNLIEQISHPVRWTESIEYLLSQGETVFEEVGLGAALTGMVRRIKNGQ